MQKHALKVFFIKSVVERILSVLSIQLCVRTEKKQKQQSNA